MHTSLCLLLLLDIGAGPNPVGRRGGLFVDCDAPTRLFFLFSAARQRPIHASSSRADCFPTTRLCQDRAAEKQKEKLRGVVVPQARNRPLLRGLCRQAISGTHPARLETWGDDKAFTPLHRMLRMNCLNRPRPRSRPPPRIGQKDRGGRRERGRGGAVANGLARAPTEL